MWKVEKSKKLHWTGTIFFWLIKNTISLSLTDREHSCWVWARSLVPSDWGWGIRPDLWPTLMGYLGTGSDCEPTAASSPRHLTKDRAGQDRGNINTPLKQQCPLCKDITVIQHVIVCFQDATMQHCFCVTAWTYLKPERLNDLFCFYVTFID